MYVIVKNIENNNYTHFSMLALNPNDTFTVKQIVLQDVP